MYLFDPPPSSLAKRLADPGEGIGKRLRVGMHDTVVRYKSESHELTSIPNTSKGEAKQAVGPRAFAWSGPAAKLRPHGMVEAIKVEELVIIVDRVSSLMPSCCPTTFVSSSSIARSRLQF